MIILFYDSFCSLSKNSCSGKMFSAIAFEKGKRVKAKRMIKLGRLWENYHRRIFAYDILIHFLFCMAFNKDQKYNPQKH